MKSKSKINDLLKALLPKKAPEPCHHDFLNFSDGGLFLKCSNCGQKWMAVTENNIPMYGWMPDQYVNVFPRRQEPLAFKLKQSVLD